MTSWGCGGGSRGVAIKTGGSEHVRCEIDQRQCKDRPVVMRYDVQRGSERGKRCKGVRSAPTRPTPARPEAAWFLLYYWWPPLGLVPTATMDTVHSVLPAFASLREYTSCSVSELLPPYVSPRKPFSALSALAKAEEIDSRRVRTSKVGWWSDVRRIKGSTWPRIWRAVTIITLWAALIAVLEFNYQQRLGLTNNVTPLLSVVVGLLLVFRNSSAFQRWDEGRKAFSTLISITRSLSRSVWINVGAAAPPKFERDGSQIASNDPDLTERDHNAKVKALRLMVAVVVATKHHLRGEYGTDYEDLSALLPSKFKEIVGTTGFGWGAAEGEGSQNQFLTVTVQKLMPEWWSIAQEIRRLASMPFLRPPPKSPQTPMSPHHHSHTLNEERTPLLHRSTSHVSTHSAVILNDSLAKPSIPLPLLITHQLGLYLAVCKKKGLLESIGPAGYNAMSASVSTLTDCFTTVERLAVIPIPPVYGIHLKQSTSLYLLTLPFTLVEIMGWKMVPFVTLCAFTLMGIEGIASEIEMPFGLDDSDLPLDLLCAELRNEIEHVISRLSAQHDDWVW
ncbi:BQ5605_C004g02889 [Microbotryum silenes-dioicae]|uniref:BQ5605_C004g02889 protein n=1 Tax=Microbotryum silenes-dioicae TaxID=796604 RepID=A0A2X0MCE7_9BASI|nr:BQ5605_C004g02889 [Microbotryum silenes-dioicae]